MLHIEYNAQDHEAHQESGMINRAHDHGDVLLNIVVVPLALCMYLSSVGSLPDHV